MRLIYDGDCNICTLSARWVRARLRGAVEIVAAQTLTDDDLMALGLMRTDVETAAYWIDDAGSRRGHLAVGAALSRIGGPWRIAGWLLEAPALHPLWSAAYDLVARYRHRLPGGTAACRLEDTRRPGGAPAMASAPAVSLDGPGGHEDRGHERAS